MFLILGRKTKNMLMHSYHQKSNTYTFLIGVGDKEIGVGDEEEKTKGEE